MSKRHPLFEMIENQKKGIKKGICSVCSANKYVIEAAMENGLKNNETILIEATCNQVNQFGGYTGMTAIDFKNFVYEIADKVKFPYDKIILAGDHLGPNPWQKDTAEIAMEKSKVMIKDFVLAGFNKIHLDASVHLGDDNKDIPLAPEVAAKRAAEMCEVAEKAYLELKEKDSNAIAPVYVIGTEVPTPGGMQEEEEEGLQVTKLEDLENTIKVSKDEFLKLNLAEAWERVIAVVIQPGVEFGDSEIIEYNREKALHLKKYIEADKNLVFEGHSTDYQTKKCLKEMVEDGIAILKVGPWLTFAVREALFALNQIENEIYKYDTKASLSKFVEILDNTMLEKPDNWKKHYHGTEKELKFARKYSMSDRARYYFLEEDVQDSIDVLISNLRNKEIPLTILSQYMPVQYAKVRNKELKLDVEELIKDYVLEVLNVYDYACMTN